MSNVPILDVHPGTGKGKAAGDYQRALDPDVAHRDGYRGVIVKFSQGEYPHPLDAESPRLVLEAAQVGRRAALHLAEFRWRLGRERGV